MGDDIQLQAAIYASLRSQNAASSGGSGGGGRSLGSFGGHGHLRSGPRHTGPAWGSNARASSGGHGAPKGKHRVRSSALKKEGILPAKKQSVTGAGTHGQSKNVKARYARDDVGSAVLDAVNKRLGSTSLEELKSSSRGGETSASHRRGASQSIWARVAGSAAGSFDWGPAPQPAAGTCGFLESFGSSKQLCVVGYKPAEGDDRQGHEALCGGNDCGQLRVDARFKCAHAAPASGHNPGFHLLLFKRSGRDQDGRIEAVTLTADAKERSFSVGVVEVGEGTSGKARAWQTFGCRELRPGVYHDLCVECKVDPSQGELTLSLTLDGEAVAEDVAIRDDWLRSSGSETTGLVPMLGLGVCKSKLEWESMSVLTGTGAAVPRAVGRFRGADMHLVRAIEEEMLEISNPITFDDIASLKSAKELLNEAVTLPLLIPEFFVGIREPWKGVLLFGPPGTGKTLLARAVASMSDIRFFNCSSSVMTSKYRGESEKLCKVLFNMARHYAPSIIFFDEVDAQVSRRGHDGEHEASRRFKSELLSQMDGISSSSQGGKNVIVLATTNCPWDVDEAMRRRLEKRIYIPLPDAAAREEMFRIHLKSLVLGDGVDTKVLAAKTDGFSGSDVKLLCRDASMMPMRRVILNKTPQEIRDMKVRGELDAEKIPLLPQDFDKALEKTKPSVAAETIAKYERWNKEFAAE